MNKNKCDRCFEVYEWVKDDEDLYKYEDKLYCWECLVEKLNDDYILDVSSITYYSLGGEYIGDENNIEEVIDSIVDNLDLEVIKNDKNIF